MVSNSSSTGVCNLTHMGQPSGALRAFRHVLLVNLSRWQRQKQKLMRQIHSINIYTCNEVKVCGHMSQHVSTRYCSSARRSYTAIHIKPSGRLSSSFWTTWNKLFWWIGWVGTASANSWRTHANWAMEESFDKAVPKWCNVFQPCLHITSMRMLCGMKNHTSMTWNKAEVPVAKPPNNLVPSTFTAPLCSAGMASVMRFASCSVSETSRWISTIPFDRPMAHPCAVLRQNLNSEKSHSKSYLGMRTNAWHQSELSIISEIRYRHRMMHTSCAHSVLVARFYAALTSASGLNNHMQLCK